MDSTVNQLICYLTILLVLIVNFQITTIFGERTCRTKWEATIYTLDCIGYTHIPTDIPRSTQLASLKMVPARNNLSSITNGQFQKAHLPNLGRLRLANCSIQRIELGSFKGGDSISFLDLSSNLITGSDLDLRIFSDLPGLLYLWLSDNPIREFRSDSEFSSSRLRQLSLVRCRIRSIPMNLFKNLKGLETLDLNGNLLTTLEWKAVLPMNSLHSIRLFNNPWHCDCKVKFLSDFLLIQRNVTVEYINSTKCASSPANPPLSTFQSLVGFTWDKLKLHRLVCRPDIFEISKIYVSSVNDNLLKKKENIAKEEIILRCEYSGVPQPKLQWIINSQIYNDSTKASFLNNTKIAVVGTSNKTEIEEGIHPNYNFKQDLIIRRAPGEGGGLYGCLVWNLAGNKSKTIFLDNASVNARSLDGEKNSFLLFGFSLWLFAVICVAVSFAIILPVAVLWIYFKRKNRRKKELVRVLTAGVVRELRNDRGSFNKSRTTLRSSRSFSSESDLEFDFSGDESESDEGHEMEFRVPRQSVISADCKLKQ